MSYGLDNWVYGANGLLGGVIHGMSNGKEVDIRGRDFRMIPDTGVFEPVAGLTQQGRVRDDWGNWFGCDNSNPLWNYPLPDHYVRRNPYIAGPSPRVYAATGPDPNLVHPISPLLERFNDPDAANHVTSGCGLGIYRDDLLGADYYENAFTCEPVGNTVYRLQLKENKDGAVVTGTRARGRSRNRNFWRRATIGFVRCRPGPARMARFTWWICIASSSSIRGGFPRNDWRNWMSAPARTWAAFTGFIPPTKNFGQFRI